MVKIVGVGNPLMGDDGLGMAVLEHIAGLDLPPNVEAVDGGTGGLTLLGLMEGAEHVILVDAADLGREPGTVLRLAGSDLHLVEDSPLSSHHSGLASALLLGREMGTLPNLVIFVMQPARVSPHRGLSPAVAAAVPQVVDRVVAEAGRLAG